jgi:hypothetical protein
MHVALVVLALSFGVAGGVCAIVEVWRGRNRALAFRHRFAETRAAIISSQSHGCPMDILKDRQAHVLAAEVRALRAVIDEAVGELAWAADLPSNRRLALTAAVMLVISSGLGFAADLVH